MRDYEFGMQPDTASLWMSADMILDSSKVIMTLFLDILMCDCLSLVLVLMLMSMSCFLDTGTSSTAECSWISFNTV